MSPLQLSVYWRLSLVFFFTSFLFFLDIFTTAVVAASCRHGNGTGADTWHGTLAPNAGSNQSWPGERSEGEADWTTESGNRDVSDDHFQEIPVISEPFFERFLYFKCSLALCICNLGFKSDVCINMLPNRYLYRLTYSVNVQPRAVNVNFLSTFLLNHFVSHVGQGHMEFHGCAFHCRDSRP